MRLARQMTVTLSRRLTGASWAEIGQCLGGRTHATVLSLQQGTLKDTRWVDMARRVLAALGCRETLLSLFPEQGKLFTD